MPEILSGEGMSSHRSKRRWLDEHHNDDFVKRARREGYRSRAVYKLLEIQARDRLLRPGQCVVDLGAAPGGWSQVAQQQVGRKGRVIALDILAMEAIDGVEFLQGDFREESVLAELESVIAGRSVDLVISDMAPNISGMTAIDQPRAMLLTELALELAKQVLKPDGDLLMKMFQGEGSDDFIREVRQAFRRVIIRKPKASRPRSREVYVLARGRRTVEN